MKPVAIFALIAAWFTVSMAAAEPKARYDSYQAYLDHINGLEMIRVEAGAEFQQAIEAIPIEADISITPEQEADLRDWLYDFLTAFSVSGSDSLAAAFYLRDGVDPGIVAIRIKIRDQFTLPTAQQHQRMIARDTKFPSIDAPPFDRLKAGHRRILDAAMRDYFFGNASFFDSAYRVFKLQGEYYESYRDYAQSHSLIPMRLTEWSPKLRGEIEEGLKVGGQWTAAEFMFIAEEPEEFAGPEGSRRYPFFVRLVWSRVQGTWRLVEAFVPHNAPVVFLFDSL